MTTISPDVERYFAAHYDLRIGVVDGEILLRPFGGGRFDYEPVEDIDHAHVVAKAMVLNREIVALERAEDDRRCGFGPDHEAVHERHDALRGL
jgi:hypothetical protein